MIKTITKNHLRPITKIVSSVFFVSFISAFGQFQQIDEKELNPCLISINDTLSAYNIIQKLGHHQIEIGIETTVMLGKKCDENSYPYIHSFIKIDDNQILLDSLANINTLIPQKMRLFEYKKKQVLIIEYYNYSATSVGFGYGYSIINDPFRAPHDILFIETKNVLSKAQIIRMLNKKTGMLR